MASPFSSVELVTTTALERFQANRRAFLFRDRVGHTHQLQYSAGHFKPYSAHNLATKRVRMFARVDELRRYLETAA